MKNIIFISMIIIIIVMNICISSAEPFEPEKVNYIYYYRASTDYYLWVESNRVFYVNWDDKKISAFGSLEEAKEWDNWTGQLIVYSKRGETGDWYCYSRDANVASFDETCTIIESNAYVYDIDGNLIYSPQGQVQANINILIPSNDGYKDITRNFVFWVTTEFNRKIAVEALRVYIDVINENGDIIQGLDYEVTYNEMSDDSTIHYLRFNQEIPVGRYTVRITYKYNDEEIGYAERIVERLAGFVDVDGDGLDDRTGQPPPYNTDIKYDTDKLGENIYTTLKDAINSFSGVFAFLSQVFSMFPVQIVSISVAFIGLLIVLRILGR